MSLQELIQRVKKHSPLLVEVAKGLEGLRRQDGIHAAAVVITNEPLTEYLPIQRKPESGKPIEEAPVVTQYEMHGVEDLGLLKMDFLGLRNLDVISDCLALIKQIKGIDLDIDAIELDDEPTFELLKRGDTIGVVGGVVGQRRFNVRIGGQANHAGTTPMSMRRDALTTAAQLVLEVERLARDHTGDPVATVGRLNVWPNAANVVPGQVELSIDLRDLCPAVLDELVANLRCLVRQIADASGCDIALEPAFSVAPTPADSRVMEAVTRACDRLGVTSSTLPSRASHDAQEMGRRWPMGMIFVPSRGGLSHSASEFTSSQQCCEGAAVLLQTLLDLDQRM